MCVAHSGMTTCLVCLMADSSRTPAPSVTKVRQYPRRTLRVVTRARLSEGDRVDVEIVGGADGFGLVTSAVVTDVDEESDGRLIATLRFADLDRAARASILHFAVEAERRQASA